MPLKKIACGGDNIHFHTDFSTKENKLIGNNDQITKVLASTP